MSDSSLREKMAEAAIAKADSFSPERIAQQWEELMDLLIAS